MFSSSRSLYVSVLPQCLHICELLIALITFGQHAVLKSLMMLCCDTVEGMAVFPRSCNHQLKSTPAIHVVTHCVHFHVLPRCLPICELLIVLITFGCYAVRQGMAVFPRSWNHRPKPSLAIQPSSNHLSLCNHQLHSPK